MDYGFTITAADHCARILSHSRTEAGLSRKDMSEVLGVSETTIKGWESGQGSPTLIGLLQWFRATGNGAAQPLMHLFCPEQFGSITLSSPADEIRGALVFYFKNLADPVETAKLHHLIFGRHGSDWIGLLDMGLAHVSASLNSRCRVAETIQISYALYKASGQLLLPPGLSVNQDIIESATFAAQEAIAGHRHGYTVSPAGLMQKETYSRLLARARTDAGVTQREMAKVLCKTERTIQNWESNYCPSFLDLLHWFRVLNLSPWPYIRAMLYPGMDDTHDPGVHRAAQQALIDYVTACPSHTLVKLAYLIGGDHGSDWYAVLEMLFEHVCEPLSQRIISAQAILLGFTLDYKCGKLHNPDQVPPDLENLKSCIDRGIKAALNNQPGYE